MSVLDVSQPRNLATVDPFTGEPIEIGIDPYTGQLAFPQWQADKHRGALDKVPPTFDLTSGLGYRFSIKRMPNVNFFVNKVNIPGITLPAAMRATPFVEIPTPGDHIQYEGLSLEFRVDVNLNNYFELVNWLTAISGLQGGAAYGRLAKNPEYTGEGVESEIVCSLLNGQKNVIRNMIYHNAWPTTISTLYFAADRPNIQYLVATATFRFIYYDTNTSV